MTQPIEETWRPARRIAVAWQELTACRQGPLRLLNAVVSKLQTRLRMTRMLAMPSFFAIEVTNACNGGCVLCPVGAGYRSRRIGSMPWDRFCRIVDEVGGYARFIALYSWGEPFLHPRIYDMISYVNARKIHTKLSSNLHAFREEDAQRPVETGLDELVVSLHGLSEETYRAYQPKHHIAEVLDKVKALVDAKRRLGSEKPDIRLGFIATRHNEQEVATLPEFAAFLGVGYLLTEASLNLRFLPYDQHMNLRNADETTLRQERLALAEEWLPQADRYVNPYYRYMRAHGGGLPSLSEVRFPCSPPWYQMTICWDGDVNLCCGSYGKRDSVGNVFDQSVRQVWNNRFYHAARRCLCGKPRRGDPEVLCMRCCGMLL